MPGLEALELVCEKNLQEIQPGEALECPRQSIIGNSGPASARCRDFKVQSSIRQLN